MKFGLLSPDELANTELILPPDSSRTQEILQKHNNGNPTKFQIGCAKWGINSWVGLYYPQKTKSADFLTEYKKLFNSIELNITFYRLSRKNIQLWREEIGDQKFTFCPKWSRRVSHLKRLKDVDENIQYFIDSCALFENTLGTTFIQLPENFGPKNFERIQHFVNQIPEGFPVHLELRHKDWFEDAQFRQVLDLMQTKNVQPVMCDVASRRDTLHMHFNSGSAFIRFTGYNPPEYDHKRLDEWAERCKIWAQWGLNDLYFYFHHIDEKMAPENAIYFQDKLMDHMNA